MNVGAEKRSLTSRNLTPSQVVEELRELVRDLQELLEGYGPAWYTEAMSTRISETLAMSVPPRDSAQDWNTLAQVCSEPNASARKQLPHRPTPAIQR